MALQRTLAEAEQQCVVARDEAVEPLRAELASLKAAVLQLQVRPSLKTRDRTCSTGTSRFPDQWICAEGKPPSAVRQASARIAIRRRLLGR